MDKRDPDSVTGRGKKFFTWYQRNTICCRDLEQCAPNLQLVVFRRELEIMQCLIVSVYSTASVSSYSLWVIRFLQWCFWPVRSSGMWRHVAGRVTVPPWLLVPWNIALVSTLPATPCPFLEHLNPQRVLC